jgi:hypothetical protein
MNYKIYISIIFIITLSILLPLSLAGQVRQPKFTEAERNWSEYNLTGWRFGINMGMYFANKYTSQYYSGEPFNENNIEFVLNNKYWYEEIFQELNSNNVYTTLDDIPTEWTSSLNEWKRQYNVQDGEKRWWIYYPINVKYDAAISPGFYAKYNFNNTTGIFGQSNYVELTVRGAFQMVIDSVTGTGEPALRTGFIRSKERRSTIDIGISKFYRTGEYTNIFIETGFHLSSLKVIESRIQIGKREYNIVNRYGAGGYVPNSNTNEYEIYQGGIGFGMFLTGGLKFILNETISIDPGFSMYWKTVNLEGYKDFSPDYYGYVRIIFGLF